MSGRFCVAVCAIIVGLTSSRADIIIDTFDQPGPTAVAFSISGDTNTFSRTEIVTVGFSGDRPFFPITGQATRRLEVRIIPPLIVSPVAEVVHGSVGSGQLNVFTNTGSTSTTRLTFTDFFSTPNVRAFDNGYMDLSTASDNQGLRLDFLNTTSSHGVPVSIVAASRLFGEEMTFSSTIQNSNRSLTSIHAEFPNFSGYQAMANSGALENIDQLTIDINDGPNPIAGADYLLTQVTAVPAPASIVLLLSIVPCLGCFWRTGRKT